MKKVLIMNSFGFFPSFPSVSTAKISNILKRAGLSIYNYDLNLAIWKELLSIDFLKSCSYKKDIIKDTEVPFPVSMNNKKYLVLKENVIDNIEHALTVFKKSSEFYDINKLNWAVNIIFQAQQIIFYHYGCFITNKVIFWPVIGFNVNNLNKIYELSTDIERNPFIKLFQKIINPVIAEKNLTLLALKWHSHGRYYPCLLLID